MIPAGIVVKTDIFPANTSIYSFTFHCQMLRIVGQKVSTEPLLQNTYDSMRTLIGGEAFLHESM